MGKFLRYEDFVDPARKDKYDAITIFDVDDTLVITKSMIRVVDSKTGEKFELTPAQFNDFEKNPNHEMDFSDFRNLELLKAGKIIEGIFKVLKDTMNRGRRVGIITARDDKDLIFQFLLHHGVVVNPNYIFSINVPRSGFSGTVAQKKKQAFIELIKIGFKDFIFYDDDLENIRLANSLGNEIKGIKIKTKHVDPEWTSKKK
jgi:FMN phosphatase YigB (HAD superfamily)